MARRPRKLSPYLPDVESLQAWLEQMVASMKLAELIVAVVALISRMRDINLELMKQLASMQRKRPRSERLEFVERQLVLAFGARDTDAPGKTPEQEPKKNKSRKGVHPGRATPPAHLERVAVPNPVPPEMRICPRCGSEMVTVSHSVGCETIEVIPARIIVLQRIDETVACPHDDAIVSAPTPPELVERGKLGPTLIVEAVADKFLEHQPVERQATRFERSGVPIAPQTLGRGVNAAIDTLAPIADLIHAQTRGPGLLGTDTTGLPVLDPSTLEGIRTGSMACWTNARWVSFWYSARGDAESVKAFLGQDHARIVQCDGTTITNFIERAGGARPGCWSHGRRKLVTAARGGDRDAVEGLHIIGELFQIEHASLRAGETAEQRRQRRLEHSAPALERLREWIDDKRGVIPPKTPLGQALGYLHRQWKRLVLILDDGQIELTNNRRERELRRLVLGRKNWLFTWMDEGGHRTANILTIIATCIAHEVNPRAYLHLVVKRIVEGWPQAKLRDLLPDRLVVAHPELALSSDTS